MDDKRLNPKPMSGAPGTVHAMEGHTGAVALNAFLKGAGNVRRKSLPPLPPSPMVVSILTASREAQNPLALLFHEAAP